MWAGRTRNLPAWADGRLAELAALGATDIALVVPWRQFDVFAPAVSPGLNTPSDADLAAILDNAYARGMSVFVLPIIELDHNATGQWRGTLRPRDIDTWWTSYERFIVNYAIIAAAHHASSFAVGSELGFSEEWRDRWRHLINRVRRTFPGTLTYSANWDHYQHVTFWSDLDAIGVTGYAPIATTNHDSEAAMTAVWHAASASLLAFAASQHLPLWLTEVGYPSRDGSSMTPGDYTRGTDIDLEEQRRAFAAFFAAWRDTPPGASFIWEWSGDGGIDDGGYSPRGKPAAHLIEAWLRAAK